jgi:hypothetical protein
MMRICLRSLRALGLLPVLAATAAVAQDDDAPFDRTPQDCLTVSRIRGTDALDDQTIIFRLRNRQVYRNTLPNKCPGLLREDRIMFETRTSQLCSVDTITVLEEFGVGFRPGFTCRLGQFVPMSPADVEELEALKDGSAGRSAIETSEVELERAEEAAEPDESDEAAESPAAEPASEQ